MKKVMEQRKSDFMVSSEEKQAKFSMTSEQAKLNKFLIFDTVTGELLRSGSNIVLNVGRLVTSSRLLKRAIEIPANQTFDSVARTITMAHSVALAAFGVGNGAATMADAFSPRLPLPADIGLTVISATNKWLNLKLDTGETTSPEGYPYALATRLKEHVSAVNPVLKSDEDGFDYVEHTLEISTQELIGNYFNEICLFFKVNDGISTYYVPYSKFSFESLPNLGGLNSYTILYGTYL